ncbi:hypothetical protein GCM10027031_00930 [Corynebacterium atrinae]
MVLDTQWGEVGCCGGPAIGVIDPVIHLCSMSRGITPTDCTRPIKADDEGADIRGGGIRRRDFLSNRIEINLHINSVEEIFGLLCGEVPDPGDPCWGVRDIGCSVDVEGDIR